jgi:E3 ubiquitin-protein ligase FANCL
MSAHICLPSSPAFETFCGFLRANEHEYRIRVTAKRGVRGMSGAQILCGPDLARLMRPHREIVQTRLNQSSSVEGFLVELQDLLDHVLRTATTSKPLPPPEYYSRIVAELDAVGWQHLMHLDESLTGMKLRCADEAGREHYVTVSLQPGYPSTAPECAVDLPAAMELRWSPGKNTCSLAAVLEQFKHELSKYQELWRMLDEIDRDTWVLEPTNPSAARGYTMRRVALGKQCFLQLEMNVQNPRGVCSCRLLGPESEVGPIRQSYNQHLHRWSPQQSTLANLRAVLGISFPSPETSEKEDVSVECGVCYAYRLAGHAAGAESFPDVVCENKCCRQSFHHTCLHEWLRTLPSSRVSFDTIFGECPYCQEVISLRGQGG